MAIFNWTTKYSVNIETIDEQHKKLFSLMDRVINIAHEVLALKSNKRELQVYEVFDELQEYIKYHFKFEEDLLTKYDYPETEDHIEKHKKLLKDLKEKHKQAIVNKDLDFKELINFFVNWLQNHIIESDVKYSKFLIDKGAR